MSTGAFSNLAFSPLAFSVDTGSESMGMAAGTSSTDAVGGSIASATGSASGTSSASASPAANFKPSDIADLILWLDVSDTSTLTLSGSAVSQIVDKSANALAYTQSTTSKRPTYSATSFPAGKPALLFSPNTQLLASALPFPSNSISDYTMFVVLATAEDYDANYSVSLGFGDGNNDGAVTELALWEGHPDLYVNGTDFQFDAPVVASTPYYIQADRDATTGLQTGSVNGLIDRNSLSGVTGALSLTVHESYLARFNSTDLLFAAAFVYSRKLTAGEKSQLYSYINDNWIPAPPASVGIAAGTSTASAVGHAITAATGSASGSSSVSAQGQSVTSATGTATGSADAKGVGASTATGQGQAAGAATTQAIGQSSAIATGTAAGSSTAIAQGTGVESATGAASGSSTASAIGQAVATATGTTSGESTADAVGHSTATSTGQSSGESDAQGIGGATVESTGHAAGSSTAEGEGQATIGATGQAAGSSDVNGTGQSIATATGSAEGSATATAHGAGYSIVTGTAAGTSTARATGKALRVATDRMTRHGSGRIRTVSGQGRRRSV